jgi:hypothetical protein
MRHRLALATIVSLLYSGAVYAVLGGFPAPLSHDHVSGRVPVQATMALPNHTEIATTLPSGTTVREYVLSNGVVFAVSWKGPFLPDLKALLGQHFDAMTAEAAKTTKAGHSHLVVNRQDIVIQSAGHMRAYEGRAWIPSLLPTGFNTSDIH